MKILLTFIFTLLPLSAVAIPQSSDINIKFGFLRYLDDGSCEIYRETREIPLHPLSTGFQWGYKVTTERSRFTIYDIARSQFPFKTVGPTFEVQDNGHTIVSRPIVSNSSSLCMDFWNHVDDPSGNQSIEIYIDGRLEETINFITFHP